MTPGLAPGLDPARLDPGRVQAAVLDLAGTARDAVPGRAPLTASTRNLSLASKDLRDMFAASTGRGLLVTVIDTRTSTVPHDHRDRRCARVGVPPLREPDLRKDPATELHTVLEGRG